MQGLTNFVTNNSVLDEESDCELSESQTGLESDHTILSGGEELDSGTVLKTAVQAETYETDSEAEKPITPAPRKSKAHLRPDFAYDFAQTTNSETVRETQMHRDAIQKVKFLKEFVKLF